MHKHHKLSLAFLTVQNCPPLDHVRIAAATGYDAVGLRLIAPHGLALAHPIVGNAALIRDIKKAGSDHGVTFLDGEVFTLLPDTDVAAWRPVLDTAAEIGMPLMQITSEDEDFSRAADNLARAADYAARNGIAIAIEFMRWRAAATIQDAERLALLSKRDNVGILLDALHLSRSGGGPAEVAALPVGLIQYLQICDAPAEKPVDTAGLIAEARGARMMPGQGTLWLRELMSVLPSDIAISVETPHRGDHMLEFHEKASRGIAATRAFLDAL